MAAVDQLDAMGGKSPKGFFYLGVALFKMRYYDQAIKAFQKSCELKADDAQLQYNLGLAYFKKEQYNIAVEHLKLCTQFDSCHLYAYNNLAFIYNMHQMYSKSLILTSPVGECAYFLSCLFLGVDGPFSYLYHE